MSILAHYNDWAVIVLMMAGLYIVISTRSFLKKVVGLNLFQTSVIIFYISMANVTGAAAPIVTEPVDAADYANPLPHVLMLTAIVVGVPTTAVGLGILVRIHEAYGTVEEDEIVRHDFDS